MFYTAFTSQPIETAANQGKAFAIDEGTLRKLIQHLLHDVEVDEAWYLQTYADVREALTANKIRSAKDHFVTHGYFEGRLPYKIVVDSKYYLDHNPDVAEAIHQGHIKSAQQHYDADGIHEGRLPFQGFSLFSARARSIDKSKPLKNLFRPRPNYSAPRVVS
jgi:hypothetical protein